MSSVRFTCTDTIPLPLVLNHNRSCHRDTWSYQEFIPLIFTPSEAEEKLIGGWKGDVSAERVLEFPCPTLERLNGKPNRLKKSLWKIWKLYEVLRGKWHMIAYSLTSISCIFELFYFLTSAPFSFQLIRVSISDFGRPFKLLIQSFNPCSSADYLLRGTATLSIITWLCWYMFRCLFGHWLADFGVYRWKSEEWN